MNARRLIVNADDLGMTEATNLGIVHAHREGIVTSASVMVTTPAFGHALGWASRDCPPPAAAIPALVDRHGRFRWTLARLWVALSLPGAGDLVAQVSREWRAQFEKVLATGVAISHVDSHRHVHLHPRLGPVAVRLAREHGVALVRSLPSPGTRAAAVPPLFSVARVKSALLSRMAAMGSSAGAQASAVEGFIGLGLSGVGLARALCEAVDRLRAGTAGTFELVTHPGTGSPRAEELRELAAVDRQFQRSRDRAVEMATLVSTTSKQQLEASDIVLTSFRTLAAATVGAPIAHSLTPSGLVEPA
jgi:predicted glycoside hydrolase/deacetylase ChbG (UPF0249 family)